MITNDSGNSFGSLLTAVETKRRSPATIGLDTARPGIGVFHSTLLPSGTFHEVATEAVPWATPDACGPRNVR